MKWTSLNSKLTNAEGDHDVGTWWYTNNADVRVWRVGNQWGVFTRWNANRLKKEWWFDTPPTAVFSTLEEAKAYAEIIYKLEA